MPHAVDPYNSAIKKAERWDKLMDLCGSYRDGSEETVTLFQDDATRSCHIRVGKTSYYGNSFESALDKIPFEASR